MVRASDGRHGASAAPDYRRPLPKVSSWPELLGKSVVGIAAVCYGPWATCPTEAAVSSATSFRQELDGINRELRKSLLKLQSLLEKKRRALKEAEILENRREQEHLEKVIRSIESKVREIREIGLPPSSSA